MSKFFWNLVFLLVVVANFHGSATSSTRKLLLGNDLGNAKVIGFVACDACLERNFTKNTVLLPGVTVSVTCKDGNGDPFYSTLQRTDRQGRFFADIPAQLASLEATHIATLCSSQVVNNPIPSCSSRGSTSSSLIPYGMQNGHKIFTSGPFVYSPEQAHPNCPRKSANSEVTPTSSDVYSSMKAGSNNPQLTFPANQLPGAGNFRFPNIPSAPSVPNFNFPSTPTFPNIPTTPASQFPVTSLFPPIPSNAPPLFPQFPPFGSGSGFPAFGGPIGGNGGGFQFPFFASPPPGSKK